MTGWLMMLAVWLIGIYPMLQGWKRELELEGVTIDDLNLPSKVVTWAAIIGWPIAEVIGMLWPTQKEETPNE